MINRLMRWGMVFLVGTAVFSLPACKKETVIDRPTAAPSATFTGPSYLHGTVGSMTKRRGYSPTFVSGYGLVVNLPDTGSPDVPGFLRAAMEQRLRSEGFGSRRQGLGDMTPGSILNGQDTAVVAVEGFMPPGAVEGTRFDVLVSALPQTGTTNLEGGFLRTTDLSLFGTNEQMRFSRTISKARGSMYLSPFEVKSTIASATEQNLQAIVIGGGVVSQSTRLELLLNQPSWTRSSQIAERINEVFRKTPQDKEPAAVAKTDLIIHINVPARYRGRVGEFLDLMEHVYTQRGPTFEITQARRLGEVAALAPRESRRVALAWQALGKRAIEVIRSYYTHENLSVRLAALQAGVHLEDQLAADPLLDLSTNADVQVRLQVAEILADLRNSLRGSRVLITLLDDDEPGVRIAAYESLMANNHQAIQHTQFSWDGQLKFTLDLVPATKPLVYVSTRNGPRVVIFNPMTSLTSPLLERIWDNQLMIRREKDSEIATVFYQEHNKTEAQTHEIAATVANLVYLMGHESTIEQPTPGLNLPFSRVVNVLYTMCNDGSIPAKFEIQQTPLAIQIAQARKQQDNEEGGSGRPWTGPESDSASPDNTGSSTGPSLPGNAPGDASRQQNDTPAMSEIEGLPKGRPMSGPK